MMNEPYVLIVSTVADVATDDVVKRLVQRGTLLRRINTEEYPFVSTLAIHLDSDAPPVWMSVNSEWLPEPTSVWYRRVRVPPSPEHMDTGIYDFCVRETRSAMIGGLMSGGQMRWMSHPAMMWQAEFKPYQLAVARRVGLRTPRTIVTNDPASVREAFRAFGLMIVKPVRSGHLVNEGQEFSVFTSRLLEEHLVEIDRARWSPAIYQELLPKKFDVRVTVVGNRLFAAYIDSQSDPAAAIDWRQTSSTQLPHYPVTLPGALVERLLNLMRELRLSFGAIDLVQTPDEDFVFLEVNPAGQWLWLDDKLGLGISAAVADWLAPEVSA
jgi:glutathione synthase/RimK-type ligase-like ATP-grasp enzyme